MGAGLAVPPQDGRVKKRELDDSHGLLHPALSFLASLLSLPLSLLLPLYSPLSRFLGDLIST
jgi:hypothetical protein